MNYYLLFVILVVMVLILLASCYILVYFQHEEDRNTAYFPKLVVVCGLSLSAYVVLMLPLDVANTHTGGTLRIDVMWQIVYIAIAVFCVGIIPFTIFYYEADDPESYESQLWTAVKYELVTFLVSIVTFFLLWVFLSTALIPVDKYVVDTATMCMVDGVETLCAAQAGLLLDDTVVDYANSCMNALCTPIPIILNINVTPPVYCMAMISFVGWFLFVLFGGIGLAALPLDLIADYSNRPQSINLEEYAKQKMLLNERAQKLLEIGHGLEQESRAGRGKSRANRRMQNKFKQAVYFLEQDWDKVKTAYKERGGNPLKYLLFLFLGGVGLIISVIWLLQLILFVIISPPISGFLNDYFVVLDDFFPLFGVITYAIFSFYLLLCVVKGAIKMGLRVLFIQIHPMKIGQTMMNSFLFNTFLLLLCSVSVVQFCAISFSIYARLTAVDMLFGIQARNLIFLSYFFQNNVFMYVFLGIAVLSFVYLLIFPKERRQEVDDM